MSSKNGRRSLEPSHFDSSDLESSADESVGAMSSKQYHHQSPQPQSGPNKSDPHSLPALQANGVLEENDALEPILEDDPLSFDLVQPAQAIEIKGYSLEKRSQALFSREHLQVIFADSSQLLKFTSFLTVHRPQSVPLLIHYLDSLKALRALNYANAICDGLEPIDGADFTQKKLAPFVNAELEARARTTFDAIVKEELPAFVTHLYIQIVSRSISSRITGMLAPHLREASEGLAEVFCLTDPSRPDNPIVFASEEFNRTTQYGMSYILGRNCRFLQGPWTNPLSIRRIRDAISAGRQHQEVFLNYRRDGSPFMNLLMIAPLIDSRGKIRYFIGAQVDVSGLAKDFSALPTLKKLIDLQSRNEEPPNLHKPDPEKNDELRELSEMLNQAELSTIRTFGGKMHKESTDDHDPEQSRDSAPRLLLRDPSTLTPPLTGVSGLLSGVYQHYLLVRPYPSLRILFASPSQRMPGILQSPFISKIGGSDRVREELTAAFAEGRGVTAKVRWVKNSGIKGTPPGEKEPGRNKWIHCTPLIGNTGQIGVWMVVIVDVESEVGAGGGSYEPRGGSGSRQPSRQAPPVTSISDHGSARGYGRSEGWDVGGEYESQASGSLGNSHAGSDGPRSFSAAGRGSGTGSTNGANPEAHGPAYGYGSYEHQNHRDTAGSGQARDRTSDDQSETSLRIY